MAKMANGGRSNGGYPTGGGSGGGGGMCDVDVGDGIGGERDIGRGGREGKGGRGCRKKGRWDRREREEIGGGCSGGERSLFLGGGGILF